MIKYFIGLHIKSFNMLHQCLIKYKDSRLSSDLWAKIQNYLSVIMWILKYIFTWIFKLHIINEHKIMECKIETKHGKL